MGVDPPGGVWAHICGSDLVRGEDGTFYVLEDNLRVPSGVSYLLENRMVAKRVFPELFRSYSIEPVDSYVGRLSAMLSSLSPARDEPTMVVLTPGVHNSAYFEHAFLAQQLGIELVEGGDLVVLDDDTVYMRTVGGLERVDVIYRRIDEMFLDPEVFRRDSYVGVPGLMRGLAEGEGGRRRARRAPASPTTRPCTPSCPRSSGTSSPRSPSCPTCPRGGVGIPTTATSCSAISTPWW